MAFLMRVYVAAVYGRDALDATGLPPALVLRLCGRIIAVATATRARHWETKRGALAAPSKLLARPS
jgi:hypothetical protein